MKRPLIVGALSMVACLASAQGKLTGIDAKSIGEGFEIQIYGTSLTEPKQVRVMGNRILMLEFDASLAGKAVRDVVHKNGLDYVQTSWYNARPPKVRVQLRLDPTIDPTVTQTSTGWTVSYNVAAQDKTVARNSEFPDSLPPVTARTKSKTTTTSATASTENPILNALVMGTMVDYSSVPHTKSPTPKATTNSRNLIIKSMTTGLGNGDFPDKTPPLTPQAKAKIAVQDVYGKTPIQTPKVTVSPTPKVTSFPTKVPPLNDTKAPAWTIVGQTPHWVSLDFVNTEVVQILKALAMQANVNIVTSPDVKGALTVSLDKVSVDEALDLVTTLAGVRYAKVGKAYVVTGSDKFNSAIRQMNGQMDDNIETRVIPIFSGEGTQIKAAVLKSLPTEANGNKVDIVLPSDELSISGKQNIGQPANTGGTPDAQAKPADNATSVDTKTSADAKNAKDAYVVLVGPAARLNDVERNVRMIDQQICRAIGVEVPSSNAMVRTVYYAATTKATTLLQAVAGTKMDTPTHAKVGTVEIYATPTSSAGNQAISLFGRENEVNQLVANFKSLDGSVEQSQYLVYELKHLDPRAIKQELESQMPGLQVSIVPNDVANPMAFVQAGAAASQGSGSAGSTATGGGGSTSGSTGGTTMGLTFPFSSGEQASQSMRLILKGSKDAIESAVSYLNMLDTAPRQVAIEFRVMDFTKDDALRIGLDWSLITGGSLKLLNLSTGASGTVGTKVDGKLGSGGAPSSFTASLDDMANHGNLIAKPNILAVDGRQSEIFVGDNIMYIKSIQSTQNGVTVESGTVQAGIGFAVLPRVGSNGEITMDLRPTVSTLRGFTDVPGGGQLPQTSVSTAQTTVNIRTGDTVALGGLIQDSETVKDNGIPILKNLPIIGRLFSNYSKQKTKHHVVLFITAKVVDNESIHNAAQPKDDTPPPAPEKKVSKKTKNNSDQISK